MSVGRRTALAGGAAALAAAWFGWPHLRSRVAPLFAGGFDFEPVPGMPGFRRIAGGATSGASPFVGLDRPGPRTEAPPDDLCAALFGARPAEGVVPIAMFTDYNCPYCRILTGTLNGIVERSDGAVRVRWHEWPLLGGASSLAARASLAADLQGAYAAFHDRLMRSRFVPTPAYVSDLARRAGIDAARLRADMDGPEVSRRLAETAALAGMFGFPGTPSLVVGRTVAVGAIGDGRLEALIAREREDGPLPACG